MEEIRREIRKKVKRKGNKEKEERDKHRNKQRVKRNKQTHKKNKLPKHVVDTLLILYWRSIHSILNTVNETRPAGISF